MDAASRSVRAGEGASITLANRPRVSRCLGRPPRRTECDDHGLAAPAGERQPLGQPLADHDAPGAHQLADGPTASERLPYDRVPKHGGKTNRPVSDTPPGPTFGEQTRRRNFRRCFDLIC